uniref:Metalloendopeptidase n=1 Tax=Mola mola TaxID=94237 RepID=A0A3Q3X7S8_MOLML
MSSFGSVLYCLFFNGSSTCFQLEPCSIYLMDALSVLLCAMFSFLDHYLLFEERCLFLCCSAAGGLVHGDVMMSRNRNADPCTAKGCKWPKTGPYVLVPVRFSDKQKNIIIRSLLTFHRPTCIRFVWWHGQQDYLHFVPKSGCWSYVGRSGGEQEVSLQKSGCLLKGTVQHEILHALGFHHEQTRSDRDQYIKILYENIWEGQRTHEKTFYCVMTNNLGTPYDFDSVMHYGKYAFSKNGQPTIVAKSDPYLSFGSAAQMSANDFLLTPLYHPHYVSPSGTNHFIFHQGP